VTPMMWILQCHMHPRHRNCGQLHLLVNVERWLPGKRWPGCCKNVHSVEPKANVTKCNLLYRCGALLKEHAEELARLTSLETGKAIRTESRIEAGVVSDAFNYFGGLAPEIKGTTIPWNPNSVTMTTRYPIGVVGAIIPWNAPLLLMALKIAPALVTGNSVIVKSAEEAPLGALRLGEIINTDQIVEHLL
jgi:acyl-CoA reductase-like NAD-dependent aldehyde dehydrogenase